MQPELPAILQHFLLSGPQQKAALSRDNDVAVTAGAGTGKTSTLVARYLALLEDGIPLRQIAAITFTRKAAREMRNRARQEIGKHLALLEAATAERRKWSAYYDELDAARIGTIHSLCGEILRAHPAEARIDPRFAVLDETEAALLVGETVEASLAWAAETDGLLPLFELLRERPLQSLMAMLLSKRLAVAEMVNRLPAEGIIDIWQEALQTTQAAMLDQILSDPAFIDARQTLAGSQAVNADDKMEVQRQMALAAVDSLDGGSLASKLRDLSALDRINLTGGSQRSWPGGQEQLKEVKEALKYMRESYRGRPVLGQSLNVQDEAIAAAMPAVYALFEYAQTTYQARKAEREAVDFDDLEALAIELLATHPEIRAYWQEQIKALLVDEFQDTNEHQRQFMRLLCPDPGKLFIVGDAKQSIYRFRGADVTVFAAEKEQMAGQNGDLIDLDISYRAHELLLAGMNQLLRPILGDDVPDRPSWVAPFAPLLPGTKSVKQDLSPPFVEIQATLGTKGEALPRAAAALAARLAHLHSENGLDYGDMAILCRASNAFQYYENALDKAGIPYLTVAGKGFYDRAEIRDLLNALQAIADPHDDLALVGLLRSPACGISDVTLYHLGRQRLANESLWDSLQQETRLNDIEENDRLQKVVTLIRDLHQQAGRIPVADIFKQFLDRTFYRAILRRIAQPRALRNTAKFLADIHDSELVSVAEFLEYAQALRDSGGREGEARATAGGAVQIMSIHAAKGLEFPVVVLGDAGSAARSPGGFLVDPNLGVLLPTSNGEEVQATGYQLGQMAAREQEEAETARLLYVALTRAEQMLLINGTALYPQSGIPSWRGWLKQLAEITGLNDADLSGYDHTGDRQHTFDYVLHETAIQATIYEPQFAATILSPQVTIEESPAKHATKPALQEPIGEETLAGRAVEETPGRVWQVVPIARRPEAPAWVVGSLVHQALALWRFPGPSFEAWVTARAREYGLTDSGQLQHARATAIPTTLPLSRD